MVHQPQQTRLFDVPTSLPSGLVYRPDFITKEEEAELVGYFEHLPFVHSQSSGGYVAKRRVINFGWEYDFTTQKFISGTSLPPFLRPLARRVAKWVDIPAKKVVEALISEYTPGSAIGWHRDNEPVEYIIGISLSGWCNLRLRPYDRRQGERKVIMLPLAPRSAYLMQKDARWKFQHSIPKIQELRYSITFRTVPK